MILPMLENEETKKIADACSYTTLYMQLVEEMAELTQAICKFQRTLGKGQPTTVTEHDAMENLIEEMADTQVVLSELAYKLEVEDLMDKVIQEKQKRTMERFGITVEKEVE